MSSTLGQRLAPFLDALGAILIFGSWFATNTLTQRAQSQTSAHQAIIDRVRHFRLYEDFAGRTRDLHVELERTSALLLSSIPEAGAAESEADPQPEVPRWSGMTATQIRQMTDFAEDLEGYAAQQMESGTAAQAMAAIRAGVEKLSTEFRSARDEYERIAAQIESSGTVSSREFAAEEELQGRVDALWKEYESAKKTMLQSGDERLEVAGAQAASASRTAKRSKRFSYVLYVLGTLIILYGRVMKSLGGKEKSAA